MILLLGRVELICDEMELVTVLCLSFKLVLANNKCCGLPHGTRSGGSISGSDSGSDKRSSRRPTSWCNPADALASTNAIEMQQAKESDTMRGKNLVVLLKDELETLTPFENDAAKKRTAHMMAMEEAKEALNVANEKARKAEDVKGEFH